jgi:hypothetical protein
MGWILESGFELQPLLKIKASLFKERILSKVH